MKIPTTLHCFYFSALLLSSGLIHHESVAQPVVPELQVRVQHNGSESSSAPSAVGVRIDGPIDQDVSFKYRIIEDAQAVNPATVGIDFQGREGILSFTTNDSFYSNVIYAFQLDDDLDDGTPATSSIETFLVQLFDPINVKFPNDEEVYSVVVSLHDDEPRAELVIDSPVIETNNAGESFFQFRVRASGKAEGQRSAKIITVDGSAMAGLDYEEALFELTFEQAEEDILIQVPILNPVRFVEQGAYFFLQVVEQQNVNIYQSRELVKAPKFQGEMKWNPNLGEINNAVLQPFELVFEEVSEIASSTEGYANQEFSIQIYTRVPNSNLVARNQILETAPGESSLPQLYKIGDEVIHRTELVDMTPSEWLGFKTNEEGWEGKLDLSNLIEPFFISAVFESGIVVNSGWFHPTPKNLFRLTGSESIQESDNSSGDLSVGTLNIIAESPATESARFSLSVEPEGIIEVPNTVQLRPGTDRVAFNFEALNDERLTGTRMANITVKHPDFGAETVSVEVLDGDDNPITVSGPAFIEEEAEGIHIFQVELGSAVEINTLFNISISPGNDSRLGIQTELIIPAGERTAEIPIEVTANNLLDLDRSNLKLTVGYGLWQGELEFNIIDDVELDLDLSIQDNEIIEGADPIPLTISLGRAGASESFRYLLQVPGWFSRKINFPAMQASMEYPVGFPSDLEINPDRELKIILSVPGVDPVEIGFVLKDPSDQIQASIDPVSEIIFKNTPIPIHVRFAAKEGDLNDVFDFDPGLFQILRHGEDVGEYVIEPETGFENGLVEGSWKGYFILSDVDYVSDFVLNYPLEEQNLTSNLFNTIELKRDLIDMKVLDLVFDSTRNQFYVATSAQSSTAPGQIAVLDRESMEVTGQLGESYQDDSGRNSMDLDIDPSGRFLYVLHPQAYEVLDLNDEGNLLFRYEFDPLNIRYTEIATVVDREDGKPSALLKMRNQYAWHEGEKFNEFGSVDNSVFTIAYHQESGRWVGNDFQGETWYEFVISESGLEVSDSWNLEHPLRLFRFVGDQIVTMDHRLIDFGNFSNGGSLVGLAEMNALIPSSESRDSNTVIIVHADDSGEITMSRYSAGSLLPDIQFMSPFQRQIEVYGPIAHKLVRWGNRGLAYFDSNAGELEIVESPLFMEALPEAEIIELVWNEAGVPRVEGEVFPLNLNLNRLGRLENESRSYLYNLYFAQPDNWRSITHESDMSKPQFNFVSGRFPLFNWEFQALDSDFATSEMKLIRVEGNGVRVLDELKVESPIYNSDFVEDKLFLTINNQNEKIISALVKPGKNYQLQYKIRINASRWSNLAMHEADVDRTSSYMAHWVVNDLLSESSMYFFRVIEVD